MARETKVGLLAGLSFIICFSVILTNRGGPGSRWTLPNKAPAVGGAGQRDEAARLGRATGSFRHGNGRPSSRRADTAIPTRRDWGYDPRGQRWERPDADHPNMSNVPRSDKGSAQLPVATGAEVPIFPDPANAASEGVPADTDRGRRSESGLQSLLERKRSQLAITKGPRRDPARTGPRSLNRSADVDPRQSPAHTTRNSGAPRSGRDASRFQHYRVVAGDTLSDIALRFYGSRAEHLVERIMHYNRTILTDPDRLLVGMDLRIPPSPRLAPVSDRTPAMPSTAPLSHDSRRRVLYQINRNDTYSSIAREQLGDSRRWHEIYELNKNKFPNPGQIRDGVTIYLPPVPQRPRR